MTANGQGPAASDPPPPPDPPPDLPGYRVAQCGGAGGPLAVIVLERVQSGLLGATLSSFGITGACTWAAVWHGETRA